MTPRHAPPHALRPRTTAVPPGPTAGVVPAWTPMALGLAALVVLSAAGPARAQSLLSAPVETWQRLKGAQPGAVEYSLDHPPSLDTLAALVNAGQGPEVYPLLAALRPDWEVEEMNDGGDVAELHRLLLLLQLRAGEGVASPAVLEELGSQFIEAYPDDPRFPLAFYYYTQARFRQGKPLEDSFFFDEAALESLPPWMQTRYLQLRAESAARQGRYAEAAGFRLREMESRTSLRATTRADVTELLEQLGDSAALEAFLKAHGTLPWLAERGEYLRLRVLINAGGLHQATLALDALRAGQTRRTPEQLKLLADLQLRLDAIMLGTRPMRIGVLLPLGSSSTTLRGLARDTLDGLRLAVQFPPGGGPGFTLLERATAQQRQPAVELRPKPPPGPASGAAGGTGSGAATATGRAAPSRLPAERFELVVMDTGNDPARAAAQVDALVREEHVIAIVGPLARAESEAAAMRAEELGVPLISFSISIDPPPGARYVFRHSKSQEDEVRDLVRYAMDYLDARRFTILYPESVYGRTMMNLFWDEVQRRGGRVLAAAGFSLEARGEEGSTEGLGLKRIFENFTGVDRAVDEQEQALLAALGDHLPDPIVDFDALFIPLGADAGRYFRLVSAYPVTVDAEHVQLLGTRFWNDSSVLVQAGGRLANSVFVDSYDQFGRSPLLLGFRQRHREMFGHRRGYQPPSYYTAVAYDTINILQRLLADRQRSSREELRRGLVNLEPVEGVTGLTSFLENGESVKESMLFKIEPRRIVRIQP